jgi:hypothetical protein
MQLTENSPPGPTEDGDFCRFLVAEVPPLLPLLEEHLEDNFDEILPYVFLTEVALWAEKKALIDSQSVRRIIAILNLGLEKGAGDVKNLILVGFMEGMSGNTDLVPMVDGRLKPWLDHYLGLSDA